MTDAPDGERVRPDGGSDAVDPPPIDALDDDALDPATLARNAPRLDSVVELLTRPALARVYVYVCYWGPVDPPSIVDRLGYSKSTTYEYVDRLVDRGILERDDSTRPQQLTADPVVVVARDVPIVVTPTVLHALALQAVDEDVEYFVDRHGVGTLVAALRGAGLHYAGRTTQRTVASDLDVRDTEAMLIVEALQPALAAGRERDPYFEYLFPDVAGEMELPDLDELEEDPPSDGSVDE